MDVKQLKSAARKMRAYNILAIHCAGSGHPGGTLSIMDIAAVLYLEVMKHNPDDPDWPQRDRCIWSAGHKTPALYVALATAGYCRIEDVITGLRKLDCPFEGHPHWLKLPGIEVSTGSLGQGLGFAVGQALDAKAQNLDYTTYCIMGDDEHDEGSVWEAVMAAGNFQLDNLIAIVDKNGLQIDGPTREVMDIDPLGQKYKAFNWHVLTIDGHDMNQILDAFKQARKNKDKPTCIIAQTVKGKGVSFMEDQVGWHGKATKGRDQLNQALADISAKEVTQEFVDKMLALSEQTDRLNEQKTTDDLPKFSRNFWWNTENPMKVEMEPTRFGFGRALDEIGDDPRLCTLHADISGSIKITDFEAKHPERISRVYSLGIAEQNMVSVACGLARNGRIPIAGTYGVFAAGRCWDQLRTTACYSNLNIKMAGAHGGISVGPDGATHQALEDIALINILPNMHLAVPADSLETKKAAEAIILDVVGPGYIRYAREATPIITADDTPYEWGIANIIRYRGAKPKFVDAFGTVLSTQHKNEDEQVAIIACGPMVPEAMRAAYILKTEHDLETRIINMHTVKPLDRPAIKAAVRDIGVIITVEEHQTGGFGSIIAAAACAEKEYDEPLKIDMVGVDDRFGQSAPPWQLLRKFGLTAEHITRRALLLMEERSAPSRQHGK
ncbi:MAG: transketolase [Planctomycetota bacterium]|jgi:transketolase